MNVRREWRWMRWPTPAGHTVRSCGSLNSSAFTAKRCGPWVRKAQSEGQDASAVSGDRDARFAQLEKENRELRRANTIVTQASAFFAAELDRPQR